jgi:hypothetical protein
MVDRWSVVMWHNGAKWNEMEEIFYFEQNFVTKHFLVGTISKVNFEVMEQPKLKLLGRHDDA